MRLYIIRHGETDWNKQKRIQGQSNIPLNDYGRELAHLTGAGMAKDGIRFDLVFTSPLDRAKETAQIIASHTNANNPCPIVDDPRIQEISFGIYEGINKNDIKEELAQELDKFFTATETYTPNGGETLTALYERVESFVKEIISRKDLDMALISTHGGSLHAILNCLEGKKPIKHFWRRDFYPNCGVTIVDIDEEGCSIIDEAMTYYEYKQH